MFTKFGLCQGTIRIVRGCAEIFSNLLSLKGCLIKSADALKTQSNLWTDLKGETWYEDQTANSHKAN